MADILLTGFPGFLASALLPLALGRRPGSTATCLVQEHHARNAADRLKLLEVRNPDIEGRVRLTVGDITVQGLGLTGAPSNLSEVFHLAAVYDPLVTTEVADAVNVGGTRHVLDYCQDLPKLQRLHYVSTCYVSGDHAGVFREDDLEVGQGFSNEYVRSKYDAEVMVRAAMAAGLPATIYRPGMVVGDSTTGATQKYDGPYFAIKLIMRQPGVAVLPRSADIDSTRLSLVPRDFVIAALSELSLMPESAGKTYALTDPAPPTIREVVETFAHLLDKPVQWVPMPNRLVDAAARLPGVNALLGIPAHALVTYIGHPTAYDTGNTTRDLAGTGVACPRFADYAAAMVEFVKGHPEVGSAAMT